MGRGKRFFVLCMTALAFAGGLSGICRADDGTPIRQFDIPTLEKLGREMYDQDKEAWKATDVLKAAHSEESLKEEKVGLWIVDSHPDGDVVRFVRNADTQPEAAYDVKFGTGGPQLSEPADHALSADELAQLGARMIALQNIARPCSDRYNTVALKDPEREGWIVWAMAATTDPNLVIIGGHYRFMISADGKTMIERDALSKGCLQMPKHDPNTPPGVTPVGNFSDQIVSLLPLETIVFNSLSYATPFYVGTLDGKMWKVADGKISTIGMDDPDPEGYIARSAAGIDEMCRVILTKTQDGKPVYYIGGETKVISATERDATFALDLPDGETASAVTCARRDIVPAPNDYKVVLAGYPLMIDDIGEGHSGAMASLEITNGQFQFRFIKGDATGEENERIQARLNRFQDIVQSKH